MLSIIKNRYDYIDISKGIGILLVVWGHILLLGPINTFIYSFHMPLFFFLSGFVFNREKYNNIRELINDKLKKIIMPYFGFSFIIYLYWLLVERHISTSNISPYNVFINIFLAQGSDLYLPHNPALWFLPCLFVVYILYYCITSVNIFKKNIYIIMIILSIIGYLTVRYGRYDMFWSCDVSITGSVFFIMGSQVKLRIKQDILEKKTLLKGIVALVLCYFLSQFGQVSLANNYYSNYLLFYLCSNLGIYGIVLISMNLDSKKLVYLGQKSMYILALHIPIKRLVMGCTSKITGISMDIMKQSISISLIDTAITLLILITLMSIINKYLKFNLNYSIYKKIGLMKEVK